MFHQSPLHQYVHKRLREAFGEPDNSLGRDDHWALTSAPDRPTINVLIDGKLEVPAVWVFDPNDHDNGVMRTDIAEEGHIDDIVKQIQERVKRAGLARRKTPSSDVKTGAIA